MTADRDDVMRRIREGRSPMDRALDIDIAEVLGAHVSRGLGWVQWPGEGTSECPFYTASVDPWLALARESSVEAVMYVGSDGWCEFGDASAQHPDPARACALAYLTAEGE